MITHNDLQICVFLEILLLFELYLSDLFFALTRKNGFEFLDLDGFFWGQKRPSKYANMLSYGTKDDMLPN